MTASRESAVRTLERAADELAAAAVARMDASLPWYGTLPADSRSWVGLVAQAGIAAFASWFRDGSDASDGDPQMPRAAAITSDVFGAAPRELARTITLRQTVELVRATTTVVEDWAARLADAPLRDLLRGAILSYSREIAFAAAAVYAQAAEARGAWDARLEALVVDAVVRGDDASIASRAAALGWQTVDRAVVVVGHAPDLPAGAIPPDAATVVSATVDLLRRDARAAHADVLTSAYGDVLVAVLGGATGTDVAAAARGIAGSFGTGPVVIGPVVTTLEAASHSAAAALSGLRVAAAWPDAPRPVPTAELLPERALAGEDDARRTLVSDVYAPLPDVLRTTLATYLERSPSMEATARALFVHPNTVRYRLQRVAEVTGWSPTDPRGAYVLRLALALGRLAEAAMVATTSTRATMDLWSPYNRPSTDFVPPPPPP